MKVIDVVNVLQFELVVIVFGGGVVIDLMIGVVIGLMYLFINGGI